MLFNSAPASAQDNVRVISDNGRLILVFENDSWNSCGSYRSYQVQWKLSDNPASRWSHATHSSPSNTDVGATVSIPFTGPQTAIFRENFVDRTETHTVTNGTAYDLGIQQVVSRDDTDTGGTEICNRSGYTHRLNKVPGLVAPAGLEASAGATSVTLNWTATPGASILFDLGEFYYDVHYTSSETIGIDDVDQDDIGSIPEISWVDTYHGDATTSHTIRGLTPGTDYRFRVCAVSAAVRGAWGSVSATPVLPPGTVWAATLTADESSGFFGCDDSDDNQDNCSVALTDHDFTYNGATYSFYVLYWQSSADELQFEVLRDGSTFSGDETKTALSSLTLNVDGTALTVSDARTTGSALKWSYNPATDWTDGQQVSLSLNVNVTAPGAPTGLAVMPGDQKLTASWNPPSSNGGAAISGYKLQHKEMSASWPDTDTDVPGTTAEITGLTNGTSYDVRVRAVNSSGSGDWSTVATGTPMSPPIVTLSASPNPVPEGSSVTVTATLSQALSSNVDIPLTFTAGSAEAGDYSTSSTPITIPANSLSGSAASVVLTNQDDDTDNETFTVALGTLPSSVTAGTPSSVEITIQDDDTTRPPPIIRRPPTDTPTDRQPPPAQSSDASLGNLEISGIPLSFDPDTDTYTLNAYGMKSLTLTPTASDSEAAITVNGNTVQSGTPATVTLDDDGETTIEIVMTAEDGTTRTYTVTVMSCPGEERKILEMFYDSTQGDMWEQSGGWNTEDDLDNWHGVQTRDGRVSVLSLVDNGLSGNIPSALKCFSRLSELSELALWDNDDLSGEVPDGLAPAVERAVLRDVAVALSLNTQWFEDYEEPFNFSDWHTGVTTDDEGRVTELDFSEEDITGEIPQSVFELQRLRSIETCKVTLETPVPGRVSVTMPEGCSDASLGNIEISPGELAFSSMDLLYEVAVGYGPESITVTPETNHPSASVTVNGEDGVSGEDVEIVLNEEEPTIIEIEVTARDGTTIRTYEITVTRCGADNRWALARFYEAVRGEGWNDNENWSSEEPLDQWFGVGTDEEGKVVSLSLSDNALSGETPRELLCLSELKELALWGNTLSGEIPQELAPAVERAVLKDVAKALSLNPGWFEDYEDPFLFSNWHEGVTTDDEGRVTELDFSGEDITGEIPQSVFELQRLRVIDTGCEVTVEAPVPGRVSVMMSEGCGDGGCALGSGDSSASALFLLTLVVFAVVGRRRVGG